MRARATRQQHDARGEPVEPLSFASRTRPRDCTAELCSTGCIRLVAAAESGADGHRASTAWTGRREPVPDAVWVVPLIGSSVSLSGTRHRTAPHTLTALVGGKVIDAALTSLGGITHGKQSKPAQSTGPSPRRAAVMPVSSAAAVTVAEQALKGFGGSRAKATDRPPSPWGEDAGRDAGSPCSFAAGAAQPMPAPAARRARPTPPRRPSLPAPLGCSRRAAAHLAPDGRRGRARRGGQAALALEARIPPRAPSAVQGGPQPRRHHRGQAADAHPRAGREGAGVRQVLRPRAHPDQGLLLRRRRERYAKDGAKEGGKEGGGNEWLWAPHAFTAWCSLEFRPEEYEAAQQWLEAAAYASCALATAILHESHTALAWFRHLRTCEMRPDDGNAPIPDGLANALTRPPPEPPLPEDAPNGDATAALGEAALRAQASLQQLLASIESRACPRGAS
jgi:hypothetical protein